MHSRHLRDHLELAHAIFGILRSVGLDCTGRLDRGKVTRKSKLTEKTHNIFLVMSLFRVQIVGFFNYQLFRNAPGDTHVLSEYIKLFGRKVFDPRENTFGNITPKGLEHQSRFGGESNRFNTNRGSAKVGLEGTGEILQKIVIHAGKFSLAIVKSIECVIKCSYVV